MKHKEEFHVPFLFPIIIYFLSFLELDRLDYSKLLYGKELNKNENCHHLLTLVLLHTLWLSFLCDTKDAVFWVLFFAVFVQYSRSEWRLLSSKNAKHERTKQSIRLTNNYRGKNSLFIDKMLYQNTFLIIWIWIIIIWIITYGFSILLTKHVFILFCYVTLFSREIFFSTLSSISWLSHLLYTIYLVHIILLRIGVEN